MSGDFDLGNDCGGGGGRHDAGDRNVQDDCDQDRVVNKDDICPCDPTKSVTDFRGLVPHEVWIEMMMMMMVVVMLMMMVMTAMSMLIDSY